jgi:hypothetical protein
VLYSQVSNLIWGLVLSLSILVQVKNDVSFFKVCFKFFQILTLGLTLHGVYVWIIRNFCFLYVHNIHLFMHIFIKKFQ